MRFQPSGRSVVVAAGSTLLEAARRAGLPLASACARRCPVRALRRDAALGRARPLARGAAGGQGEAPEPDRCASSASRAAPWCRRPRGDDELLVNGARRRARGGRHAGHPDRARDGRRQRRERRRDRRALSARRVRRLRDPLVRQHLRLRRHDARRPRRARDPDASRSARPSPPRTRGIPSTWRSRRSRRRRPRAGASFWAWAPATSS